LYGGVGRLLVERFWKYWWDIGVVSKGGISVLVVFELVVVMLFSGGAGWLCW